MNIKHDYSIQMHKRDFSGIDNIRASQIIAAYERESRPIPASLIDICENGIRYSNQDFDVLSAALAGVNWNV